MHLGLALPHYDTSYRNEPVSWTTVRECALTAERAGYASVWISDHLFLDWGKYGGPSTPQASLECWTTMSALAAATSKVRIGSLTLCNDLRSPALLAKMAASLDLLSGGRVDVGLGAGWYEPEYRAAGIDFDSPATRIRRLGEAVEILGRLLAGEELTFDGEHYQVQEAICLPRPQQSPRPPVWIGGKGDLLLRTAARVADGWNFSWIGSFDTYQERSRAADRACEDAGRDPASLRRSVGCYVLAGRDDADVKRRFERLVERTPEGVFHDSMKGSAVSWETFRRDHVAGTVGEVTDRLGRLSELGVSEVVVTAGTLPFQVADPEDVELLGTEVAAALQ
ncbi:MAG TPA: LLM class flavin-dependent oxidoreductase [Actinomycetota bacterium]|nr:LLM class flavin-dependent oxidoreductase [Actinomycetota bacterium]